MSTDRELLALAAKAVGHEMIIKHADPVHGCLIMQQGWWNPLTNDGDALRLAVKLGICYGPNFDGDTAVAFGREGRNICELHGDDPYAATRRAIVRAAAAIGKTMP